MAPSVGPFSKEMQRWLGYHARSLYLERALLLHIHVIQVDIRLTFLSHGCRLGFIIWHFRWMRMSFIRRKLLVVLLHSIYIPSILFTTDSCIFSITYLSHIFILKLPNSSAPYGYTFVIISRHLPFLSFLCWRLY